MTIYVQNIGKSIGNTLLFRDVTFNIEPGQTIALIGASGSGKSTLLRILAGYDQPDEGVIWFDDIDATTIPIADLRRRTGFMFQDYALFKHLTVYEHIAFGLHMRFLKIPDSEKKTILHERRVVTDAEKANRVQEILDLLFLNDVAKEYPRTLSGGQKQRVALGRCLASDPQLLLLDEPFSALDPPLRKHLSRWLRRQHMRAPISTVLITHNYKTALDTGNNVILLEDNTIIMRDEPPGAYQYLHKFKNFTIVIQQTPTQQYPI